jgi:hypothetical protein
LRPEDKVQLKAEIVGFRKESKIEEEQSCYLVEQEPVDRIQVIELDNDPAVGTNRHTAVRRGRSPDLSDGPLISMRDKIGKAPVIVVGKGPMLIRFDSSIMP